MQKKLKENYDALVSVNDLCKKYSEIWQFITAFVSALAAIGIKIESILNVAAQQEKNTTGVAVTKGTKKRGMAKIAVAIAQGLQAYGESIQDPDLIKEMSISYTEIKIMDAKNAPALAMCMLILSTASGLPQADMLKFGISPVVLQTLTDSIASYSAVQESTRAVKTNKTKLTKNLSTLVKEGNSIMRKEILKIARQFEITNPDFYYELLDAAKVQTQNIHSKIRIFAVEENGTPIENAMVTISGSALTGKTDADGKCTITKVTEGTRTVTVSKPGKFEDKVFADLNFQRGKSINRKAVMIPPFDVPGVTEKKKEKTTA